VFTYPDEAKWPRRRDDIMVQLKIHGQLVVARSLLILCHVSLYIYFLPTLQRSCAANVFHRVRCHVPTDQIIVVPFELLPIARKIQMEK
jgi:hypothetical protein